ncbi:MAG: GNAT family N-acetyltransferase [Clostridia bacterium]|nr:GNAT family N-acetyltransferase [Clostridia bacterium]
MPNAENPTVRPAEERDLPRVGALLLQVNEVHHQIRPDLFKTNSRKYNDEELRAIFRDPETPVFVYDAGGEVYGYAFCILQTRRGNNLVDGKTLYLDDLCVDEAARGRGIGTALYRYVLDYAKRIGCHNVTLNVWEGNDAALAFYRKCGMTVQKTGMDQII